MKFNRKDVLVGLIILAALAGLVYWFKYRTPKTPAPVTTTPVTEAELEDTFNLDIPDNVEKAELRDVTGGEAGGIATRDTILAELPDPVSGFYQAWLVDVTGKLVSLGTLRVAKGGYLLEYNSSKYPGYNKVVVSLEKVLDGKLEIRVLEGSF